MRYIILFLAVMCLLEYSTGIMNLGGVLVMGTLLGTFVVGSIIGQRRDAARRKRNRARMQSK